MFRRAAKAHLKLLLSHSLLKNINLSAAVASHHTVVFTLISRIGIVQQKERESEVRVKERVGEESESAHTRTHTLTLECSLMTVGQLAKNVHKTQKSN
jgi:hypothetical protein